MHTCLAYDLRYFSRSSAKEQTEKVSSQGLFPLTKSLQYCSPTKMTLQNVTWSMYMYTHDSLYNPPTRNRQYDCIYIHVPNTVLCPSIDSTECPVRGLDLFVFDFSGSVGGIQCVNKLTCGYPIVQEC